MNNKMKMIYIVIAALLVTSFGLLIILFTGSGKKTISQEFTDTRAYRTAIDVIYDDLNMLIDPVVRDPSGTMDYEALRSEAAAVYTMVNDKRQSMGLKPLVWDARLEESSFIRAEELAYTFDHTRPSGEAWYMADPEYIYGESIYKGYKSAEAFADLWLDNKADSDNFLCDFFTRIGIGIYEDASGYCYWAACFGCDSIKVSMMGTGRGADVWILQDTDANRTMSTWGPAMIKLDKTDDMSASYIPVAADKHYLFRMIDEDEIYYECKIDRLLAGWTVSIESSEDGYEDILKVYDDNGELVSENILFRVAL